MAEDLKAKAGLTAIEVGGTIITLVVGAAVALALLGGNLIDLVNALL